MTKSIFFYFVSGEWSVLSNATLTIYH